MAGSAGGEFYVPEPEELIALPQGSELFALLGRMPVGVEPDTGDFALLAENPYRQGEPVQAVAAFMAPAHTALYTTAFVKRAPARQAPLLPLFAYTAVGECLSVFSYFPCIYRQFLTAHSQIQDL